MLIRFNPRLRGAVSYAPPIPVTPNFSGPEPGAPSHQQINDLLWIPAFLVGKFIYQYPSFHAEGDELFSLGVEAVVELVHDEKPHPKGLVQRVFNLCVSRFNSYGSQVGSVIGISRPSQYRCTVSGRGFPKSITHPTEACIEDDHSELLIRDAAVHLGYDLDNLTKKQAERLLQELS